MGWIDSQRRRWFGHYTIDDPRPIAAAAPYTFHLPSENELLAVTSGDLVKVIIRSVPPSPKWDAERMWVTVTGSAEVVLTGRLENVPYDMPQIRPGMRIRFSRSDIIDIEWPADRSPTPPAAPPRRCYWDRCLVDAGVLAGDGLVDFLYREERDMSQDGDGFPDSGWRLRGTDVLIAADQARGAGPEYVALGAVLNQDDSWLPLIDSPVGSRFVRSNDGYTMVVDE